MNPGSLSDRRSNTDSYNNVEVVSLSTALLDEKLGASNEIYIRIEVATLNSEFQPFSLVVTGDFEFDKVSTDDNTANDFDDIPKSDLDPEVTTITIPISLIIMIVIIIVLLYR